MENSDIIEKLRERYSNIHALIFKRSCEYANTPGELFDILEEMPHQFPIRWDDSSRKWQTIKENFK